MCSLPFTGKTTSFEVTIGTHTVTGIVTGEVLMSVDRQQTILENILAN